MKTQLAIAAVLLPLSVSAQTFFVTVDGGGATVGSGAAGVGTPYPSTISITDSFGIIVDLNVVLHGVTHAIAQDFDIVLVGPNGQSVMLMSDSGGNNAINGLTLTFDDAALAGLGSGQIVSGTYLPSNNGGLDDGLPGPGPSAPYGPSLAVFNNITPMGDWQLFVYDDKNNDGGQITGWSLQMELTPVPEPSTYALLALGLGSVFLVRRRMRR
jgi:subtilisin-like proprotein convertase family protein